MKHNKRRIIEWVIPLAFSLALTVWSVGVSYADDGYRVTKASATSATELQGPGVSLFGAAVSPTAGRSFGGGYAITGGVLASVADPPHAFPIPALSAPGLIALAALLLIAYALRVSGGARKNAAAN